MPTIRYDGGERRPKALKNIANQDIREFAKSKRVNLWAVAEEMGIWESALSRKLRHELPPAEKEKIISIIQKLSGEES